MREIIPRTCTAVVERSERAPGEDVNLTFQDLRNRPAYVLLGDPGMGKTTAFEGEAKALGDKSLFISARDFLASDLNVNPDWRERTLFIDGLDEIRVGAYDARLPFDEIRRRLDQLGKPFFRLSCRVADWLGTNDRDKLTMVAPNGAEPEVVLLNPLTYPDIKDILGTAASVDDPDSFMEAAKKFGVLDLLTNPQTLELMVKAVAKDGSWPQSRLQTFEMACQHTASEVNEEHRIAGHSPTPEDVLGAAGRICALLLLSGCEGVALDNRVKADDWGDQFPNLNSLGDCPDLLRVALRTRLFKSLDEERFAPVHRHIAEFLGARYLHRIIENGLPSRRISALMAGYDGRVVTEFRGLSAWLATQCPEVRRDFIARDPVGVGLYGDIRNFQVSEKRGLLSELSREDSRLSSGLDSSRAFASLAIPDLEDVFRAILTDRPRQNDAQAFIYFVIRVLCHGEKLQGLVPDLLKCVHDASLWSETRGAALKALIRHCDDRGERIAYLTTLLQEVHLGTIQDSGHELLGILLSDLYPNVVSPSEVWGYLRRAGPTNVIGTYIMFWRRVLLSKSNGTHLSELLDCADKRLPSFSTLLHGESLQLLLLELLARAMEEIGDAVGVGRLYRWLSGAASRIGGRQRVGQAEVATERIRSWLDARPDVQKALILEGLNGCVASGNFRLCASNVPSCLFGATPPGDMGLWSLDQAVTFADVNPEISEVLLNRAVHSFKRQSDDSNGLSSKLLNDRCRDSEFLTSRLQVLMDPPKTITSPRTDWDDRKYVEELLQEKRQWMEFLSSNQEALLENRAPPSLLFELARTYFGDFFPEPGLEYGSVRLEKDIEDATLMTAALKGIIGTLKRTDVPEVGDFLRLRAEGRMHFLVFPFLAALHELNGTPEGNTSEWDLNRIRKALIFYFSTAHVDYQPWWYWRLLDEHPEIVADIHVEFATSEFRTGAEYVSNISQLAHDPDHSQVAHLVGVRLLRAFPTQCKSKQLALLDDLLWAAIRYGDRASLQDLVEVKVLRRGMNVAQRARWMAASLVVSPEKNLRRVEEFFCQRKSRVKELVDFFPDRIPCDLAVPAMELLVRTIGATTGPTRLNGFVTRVIHASEIVGELIRRMGSAPSADATEALKRLVDNAALSRWKDALQIHLESQKVVRRDAHFSYPKISEINQVFASGTPANAGDLWALLIDLLEVLSTKIRSNNTDDWRQYWNEPTKENPTPKHEEQCRDALLSDLRSMLPRGVYAQPEPQYARDKRADIHITFGDFQVPVEIKKNSHRNVWSAIDDQLIPLYVASAPETGGHGIYLVFWFGESYTKVPPPSGILPKSAEELREHLEKTVNGPRSLKIAVCVVDVSRPT